LQQSGSASKQWQTVINSVPSSSGAVGVTAGGSATATDIFFDVWITYTGINSQAFYGSSGAGAPSLISGTGIARNTGSFTNSSSWYFLLYAQKGTANNLMRLENYFFELYFV